MAFKRLKPVRPAASAPIESQIAAAWRHVETLIEEENWDEARDYLENLHHRYPSRKEPLRLMLNLAIDSKDTLYTEDVLDRLVKVAPDDANFAVARAGVTLTNGHLAQAREQFIRFLERWPKHSEAAEARKTVAALEKALAEMMDRAGMHQANRFELGAKNDEIQSHLERGRYAEARGLAQQMLEQDAFYAPALNNLALTHLFEAHYAEAVTASRRVLEFEPDNVHALANLAHALFILGRNDEAMDAAARMRASTAFATDKTAKIMETLSFLGDDAGVLAAYERDRDAKDDASVETPMPHHLAAAAAMRLGDEKKARRLWKKALKLDPDFSLAAENLEDLDLPIGERDAPWAFSMGYWLRQDTLRDLIARADVQDSTDPEQGLKSSIDTALESHPYLERLVPILLERGDPPGRQFALFLAKIAGTPRMLEALRDFALSQNGTDRMRMDAATRAMQAGMLEREGVRMWMRGKWTDASIIGWELHSEVVGSHPEGVEDLLIEALEAVRQADGKRAEKLLNDALEIEPDAPSLLFNLANAYKLQRREDEASELILDIHERFPTYFFGKIGVAEILVSHGDIAAAERLLTPLLAQQRFHYSEFAALALAHIQLFLAKNDEESARHWYEMLKQSHPDHQGVRHFSRLFEPLMPAVAGVARKLFKAR